MRRSNCFPTSRRCRENDQKRPGHGCGLAVVHAHRRHRVNARCRLPTQITRRVAPRPRYPSQHERRRASAAAAKVPGQAPSPRPRGRSSLIQICTLRLACHPTSARLGRASESEAPSNLTLVQPRLFARHRPHVFWAIERIPGIYGLRWIVTPVSGDVGTGSKRSAPLRNASLVR